MRCISKLDMDSSIERNASMRHVLNGPRMGHYRLCPLLSTANFCPLVYGKKWEHIILLTFCLSILMFDPLLLRIVYFMSHLTCRQPCYICFKCLISPTCEKLMLSTSSCQWRWSVIWPCLQATRLLNLWNFWHLFPLFHAQNTAEPFHKFCPWHIVHA